MTDLIAGMTVSLDGFVTDPSGNSEPLYPDLAALRGTSFMEDIVAATGAVLMGRKAFDMADDPDWFAGNYEFQRPIVVLTHRPPARHPKETDELTFSFVGDLAAAVAEAKAAAGGRSVHCIGGADVIEQLVRADLVDELWIDVMPIVLGAGRRFLDGIGRRVDLEKRAIVDVGARTSIRCRVKR